MIYLNGQLLKTHECGYTSFEVRLDNATTVNYGSENVVAIWVDAMRGSGWWYEGGGIFILIIHRLLTHFRPL